MTTALVLDGDQRPALAIVRSLGRRGITVHVGDCRPASLASSSRYCASHVVYPSPEHNPQAFQQFLLDFVERTHVDVLLPVTDVTTHAVSLLQDALGRRTALAVPPFDAYEATANKWTLLQRAASCGIRIPQTHLVDGVSALQDVIDRVQYPAVIKPVRSRIPVADGWISGSVMYATSAAGLQRLYDETPSLASYPSLIQERIVGPGVGVFALFDRGRPVATFGHRRLREKPPSGGVSVLRESIPVATPLASYAAQLLGPLNWHGVAMLEFKQDHRTGDFYLMEVNGRFWGSLQLAVDAGLDFPFYTYQLALGQPLDIPAAYKTGIRSRWLLGDLDHLLARLTKSDRDLQLPDGAPSKLRTIAAFLNFAAPGLHYEVLTLSDPRPGLYEIREYLRDLMASEVADPRRGSARRAQANTIQEPVIPA
jgi:predicted ATP-grasp superfamily ATP-dependent carboligase